MQRNPGRAESGLPGPFYLGKGGEEMENMDALQYWKAAAAEYRRVQQGSDFSAQNRALVEQRFEKIAGKRVLDAGCTDCP